MKTLVTKEKRSAPAVRKARPCVHHPVGPVQRAQQAAMRKILWPGELQAEPDVGEPDGKYEQEPGRLLADLPVSAISGIPPGGPGGGPLLQRAETEEPEEEEEEPLQAKLIQRQPDAEEEEEPVQAKRIQRQVADVHGIWPSRFGYRGTQVKAQQSEIRRVLRSAGAQAKLTIRRPDDKCEQEADRIAGQVMAMPDPTLQRQIEPEEEEEEQVQARPLAEQITPLIQRQVEEEEEEEPAQTKLIQRQAEEEEEDEDELQAKSKPGETRSITRNLHSRVNSLRGGGRPLSGAARSFFEPRFGADLSKVRVHNNAQSANIARSVGAREFTVGRDVVFNTGHFQPHSSPGRLLLAHELTHVVQQNHCSKVQLQRKRSEESKLYWQIRKGGRATSDEYDKINKEIDERFWTKHESEIAWGTKLEPDNPKHWRLIRSWLAIRDVVIRELSHGSLGVKGASGHWEFAIQGRRIIAVPTPGASCADLANGKLCKDPPDASKPIDITNAFPKWVKKALARQAASGIRFTQPTPESEVGGYAAFDFDLGYGTCHGTSLAIFQIFEELPITSWTKKYGDTPLETPPKRVPTELGGFPPRERAINVLEESDKAAVATAHYLRTSKPGGHRWIGFVEVGDRALMKHIQLLGGKKTKVPRFGSWGYANDRDHSAIALGRVGKDRVYVLQKMNPMNPYYINVQPIANYDWHEIPPGKIKAKK